LAATAAAIDMAATVDTTAGTAVDTAHSATPISVAAAGQVHLAFGRQKRVPLALVELGYVPQSRIEDRTEAVMDHPRLRMPRRRQPLKKVFFFI
jgi:hypothetical protein